LREACNLNAFTSKFRRAAECADPLGVSASQSTQSVRNEATAGEAIEHGRPAELGPLSLNSLDSYPPEKRVKVSGSEAQSSEVAGSYVLSKFFQAYCGVVASTALFAALHESVFWPIAPFPGLIEMAAAEG
jgi:hypothetical protein